MGEASAALPLRQTVPTSRRSKNVPQAVLTKTLKAMQKAGIPVGRIKIDVSGAIVIIPATDNAPEIENEWDSVK